MKNVEFAGYTCKAEFGAYVNGATAISLVDVEDGSPVATATVCIPGVELLPGEVIIKTYSENEGMAEALVKAGVIEPPHTLVRAGHTFAEVARLAAGVEAAV